MLNSNRIAGPQTPPFCFRSRERFSSEAWWKYTAGERGLFRFLRAEDAPPEQFVPLAVRHLLGSSLAGLVGYGRKRFKK